MIGVSIFLNVSFLYIDGVIYDDVGFFISIFGYELIDFDLWVR